MRSSLRGGRPTAAAVGPAAVVAVVLTALLFWSLWPSGTSAPSDFGTRPRAQVTPAGAAFEGHQI
ncbi:hypothetical protein ACFWH4_33215 [Streptomyces sp. NPDC127091]|uniref:hypothetical protein n=1 Tax=Streptomyces sp. NPDC127091 TaxID=3347134 RepID=UPI00366791CC